jgi:pimeloyl-ACP methyl ester carboxylesterase
MTAWLLLPFSLIGLVLLVIRIQRRFIYFPRRYTRADLKEARVIGVQEIRFRTSQGNQTAFFWRNSDSGTAPQSLWLLFGGNGTVALDWMGLLPHFADPRTAFLLIEYPGYGICEGSPSPQSILENSENAFRALLEHEHWNLRADAIRVLGHSLGGAAALQFAAKHPVRKIVAISTFTTMADMVRATIRISLGRLLRHRFNNVASMKAILSQNQVPEINIFHGQADRLVPVHMGRALSELDPSRIKFVEIPGADHNDVLDQAVPLGLGATSRQ